MEIFKIGSNEYRFECKVNDKNELFYLCVVELPVKVVAEYRSDGYGGVSKGKWFVKPKGVEYKDIFGHVNTTQENSVRKV